VRDPERGQDGRHKFNVKAIDEFGNADPTAATFSWKVLKSG
jgi:hypothetical protein